ncbi:DUF4174 domain-containing protein [Cerasicoccus fimbriatus]|uniref:DUF4174 domain-containing protein n=1 Tax=Cerasicoccus fimbriatus TaxID=3014554 RepID=UPI0022B2DE4A|nr:DUF4174 domain-containing protein [Cerasicoccus sp. TK19100]
MKLSAIVTGFAAFSAPLLAQESAKSLEDFRWEHRILLAKIENEKQLAAFNLELDQYAPELLDRKLVVLYTEGDHLWYRFLDTPPVESGKLIEQIGSKLKDQDLVLIGLDGGAKAQFDWSNFELQNVFAQIDRMPMRRAELRERQ